MRCPKCNAILEEYEFYTKCSSNLCDYVEELKTVDDITKWVSTADIKMKFCLNGGNI